MTHRSLGQSLVLFVLSLVAMVTMVGLVVDGGNAYAQQRATQNAADAASEVGATVLAQSLLSVASGGAPKTDANVRDAINASAAANGVAPFHPFVAYSSEAYYTDFGGNLLTSSGAATTDATTAVRVGSGAIPPCLSGTACIGGFPVGIKANADREFSTYLSGVVGITKFTASTSATAVAGYQPAACDSAQGCGLLPVTFATTQAACNETNTLEISPTTPWTLANPIGGYTPDELSILVLCQNGPGAFGWLDLTAGVTIADEITTPQQGSITLPTWFQVQTGANNSLDGELAQYYGDVPDLNDPGDTVVLIPMFDGRCWSPGDSTNPTPPARPVCSRAAVGNNTWFRIPMFVGFLLDRSYTSGSNGAACNNGIGTPNPIGGNGAMACFKGWFVYSAVGPQTVVITPQPGNPATPFGVQLIK